MELPMFILQNKIKFLNPTNNNYESDVSINFNFISD